MSRLPTFTLALALLPGLALADIAGTAMHADPMLGKGDLGGQRVWLRIVKAVEALLQKRPGDGAAAH